MPITASVAPSVLIRFMCGAKLVWFYRICNYCSIHILLRIWRIDGPVILIYWYLGPSHFPPPGATPRGLFSPYWHPPPHNSGHALRMPPYQFTYPLHVGRLLLPNVPPAFSPRPGYCQRIGIRPPDFSSAWRMAPRLSAYPRCVGRRSCPISRPPAPRRVLPPYRWPLPPWFRADVARGAPSVCPVGLSAWWLPPCRSPLPS